MSTQHGIVQSSAMREAVAMLQTAIDGAGGVLVSGEPGTGREAFARAIHSATSGELHSSVERLLKVSMSRSPNGRPFVVVDCTATETLEQRLFGCAPFATTPEQNALDRIREGSSLHAALDGTIVLSHLTEMPAGLQKRLARILRDREVSLVASDGTERSLPVAVRPIATVDTGATEGRILPDLLKRVAQITIAVPSLRDRREDIPSLVRHLVREICRSLKVPRKSASRQAVALLAALPWRGNIKELRELLRTLVVSVPGSRIRLADVLANIRLDGGASQFAYSGSLKEARSRFEREYVASVLGQHRGRMADAAKALGIQRTNLYRKVRQLSVPRRRAGAQPS